MKNTSKLMITFLAIATVSCLMAVQVWAAPKLIVEDATANPVFSVEDTGATAITGVDVNNPFSYKVFGHTGGVSHTQTITDLADSRLTVMAAEAADQAPRLQMIGPKDSFAPQNAGAMIFDYGSKLYDVPNAFFYLRHMDPTSGGIMLKAIGRSTISFPISTVKVGFGFDAPTHLIHLSGGAYSDGGSWVNGSSRELKKDIQEVSAQDAIKTVESLKPVSFVYKEGNQDVHIGFIAEDVPEMVATPDRKGLESMDIAAVLTKVVQEQQRMLKEQNEAMAQLQDKVISLQNALQFKQDKEMLGQNISR